MNWKLKIENGFALLEFDQPDSKVNVLSALVLEELRKIVEQLRNRSDLKGFCLFSYKPDNFIAGADIREIEKIASPPEAEEKIRRAQKLFNDFAALPFPTIALINGACLGGGLELALACDYRLASFGEKVRIGLPEVKLGVIPGFGGTYRLPRLIGLRKSLEMIGGGELLSPEKAFKIGLVDGLAPASRLLEVGLDFLRQKAVKRKRIFPPLKSFVDRLLDRTSLGRTVLRRMAQKIILKTTKGFYPAPLQAVAVVAQNYTSSLEKALHREASVFSQLVVGAIAKNLISLFFLQEKYKKEKWVAALPLSIHKCGILGAGVMGGGIAQIFSFYALPVRLKDLNCEALGKGLSEAQEVYNYALKKRKIKSHQVSRGMALISPTLDYQGFSNADLIVEAVVEDLNLKQKVFAEISALAKPSAILASNTSCLSIAQIGEKTRDPSRVVGLHFFNPVHRMPLIEVIRSSFTSEEVVATLVDFSRRIRKTPIVVKDECGFLVNRILIPYLVEAGYLLEEGENFEKIDQVLLKFGMPMGPFALMDEIGLDVGYKVAALIEAHFGERMKAGEILKKIYEKKWFGKKVGRGFYLHKGKEKVPNRDIYLLFSPGRRSSFPEEEILSRLLYRMVNEAALCLEEKVCSSPCDVDMGMIMGTGFPPFRGGLLRYADVVGGDKIVEKLKRFQDQLKSRRFTPAPYLLELAKKKRTFYKE